MATQGSYTVGADGRKYTSGFVVDEVVAFAVPVQRTDDSGKIITRDLINCSSRISLIQRKFGWEVTGKARPLNKVEWLAAIKVTT